MKDEFIPWPDYAICPNCKKKVNLPKNWELNLKPSKRVIECPNCKTPINYIKPGVLGPPLSTKLEE